MPDFAKWEKLEVLSFHKTILSRMPTLPQSIVVIDYTDNNEIFAFVDFEKLEDSEEGFGEEGLQHPERYVFPNIEEVYLNNANSITEDLLKFLLRASIEAGNLRILAIGGRHGEPANYPTCESLECLDLTGTSHWDEDQILEMVVDMYPNLTELNLSKTKITGYGLKKITQRPEGPLAKVILKGCTEISLDTYEYLESVGTVVVR